MSVLNIFTDGGARGNPGPAAIGYQISLNGKLLTQTARYIGETTNNTAEYTAIIDALALGNLYGLSLWRFKHSHAGVWQESQIRCRPDLGAFLKMFCFSLIHLLR